MTDNRVCIIFTVAPNVKPLLSDLYIAVRCIIAQVSNAKRSQNYMASTTKQIFVIYPAYNMLLQYLS